MTRREKRKKKSMSEGVKERQSAVPFCLSDPASPRALYYRHHSRTNGPAKSENYKA